MALIRSDLDTLAEYIQGRVVPGATKLVSNEVALPPPAAVFAAIVDAATGTNRYPDQSATELSARLGRYLGVDAARIATGCGSVSICQQLVQTLGERTHAFAEHCLGNNLVVRPFYPEGVRVTVSTPDENDAFLAAALSFTR